MNQPASFAVQLNGARGVIDARVHTPSGAVEECSISELDSGELARPCRKQVKGRGWWSSVFTYPLSVHRQAHHSLHPP